SLLVCVAAVASSAQADRREETGLLQALDERIIKEISWIRILRLGKFFGVQVPQLRSHHLIPDGKVGLDIRGVGIIRRIKYLTIIDLGKFADRFLCQSAISFGKNNAFSHRFTKRIAGIRMVAGERL